MHQPVRTLVRMAASALHLARPADDGQPMRPHKALIYRAPDGWRYRVKAGNGRIVEASEEAFYRKVYARKRVESRWPGVEVVER